MFGASYENSNSFLKIICNADLDADADGDAGMPMPVFPNDFLLFILNFSKLKTNKFCSVDLFRTPQATKILLTIILGTEEAKQTTNFY